MYFNPSLEIYEGVMLLKQGIYNYKYVVKTLDKLLTNFSSDSYASTENRYLILVYYSEFGTRHDALIDLEKLHLIYLINYFKKLKKNF